MLVSLKQRLEKIAGQLSAFAQTHAKSVLCLSIVLALAGLVFVKNEIGINTDTENMLSERLPWRETYREFKANFPIFSDSLVIVIDGQTPDLAQDSARQLATQLAKDKTHFNSVTHPAELDFFRRNQFLYLSPQQLQSMADRLSQSQAIISQLLENPSVTQLLATLNSAYSRDGSEKIDGLDVLNRQLTTSIGYAAEQKFYPMSWQTLFESGKPGASKLASSRVIFSAKPVMDFAAILPAEAAIESLHAAIGKIEAEYSGLIDIRITGSAALAHDEMMSVITGSMKAGIFALLMVLACLYLGLRSWVLVLSTLVTLLVGLTFTATFAVAAVGTLNMISIAFAVLYVGLGVDFAIHTCLRYKELLKDGPRQTKFETLNSAVAYVGASIALCAVTTAIGFFAFIPTDFKGVAELGLIAGVGMFISLITTLVVLPALLQLLPQPRLGSFNSVIGSTSGVVTPQNAKAILVIAGCLWFVTAISISFVSFDINPLNLNDQNAESVELVKELSEDGDFNLYSVSVLTDDLDGLNELTSQMDKLVSVDAITSVDTLVPKNQDEKFFILDDLALIIGDELVVGEPRRIENELLIAELRDLKVNLDAKARTDSEIRLTSAIEDFLSQLDSLDAAEQTNHLELLEKNVMASFRGRIDRLNDGLNPSEISIDNIPPELRELWVSPQGKFRLEMTPREDLSDNHFLRAFVEEIQGVIGDKATGTAVINVGAAEAVQSAFIQAFSYALILIAILLWLILRSPKEVIVTLFPLLLAGLITCGAVVLFELQFNFANVIALPLLLGIGVDSAIHLLHRHKTESNPQLGILQTSTARSVFFSAATTTVSFGNLAISNHAGTASMGVVLTIGIVSVLFCMLLILPAMLLMFVERMPNSPT